MSLLQIPESYLYGEYNDDSDLRVTRKAFNEQAQAIYSWLVSTCLSDYRQDPVSGSLLDWVGLGLYGMTRRLVVPTSDPEVLSPWASGAWSTTTWAASLHPGEGTTIYLSDDLFRRSLTWNTYLGDGPVFTTTWLRRRILRFLNGPNGFDLNVSPLYGSISLAWTSRRSIRITLPPGVTDLMKQTLAYGLSTGYLRVPVGYTFTLE